jgi:hypothetical protein
LKTHTLHTDALPNEDFFIMAVSRAWSSFNVIRLVRNFPLDLGELIREIVAIIWMACSNCACHPSHR